MPEPLATTKRKFHKLLDTLSRHANATVVPLSTQDDDKQTARDRLLAASDRVSKRRRVEEQLGTPSRPGSTCSIHSSPDTTKLLHLKPLSSQHAHKADSSIPAFSPWSQDSFLRRLKTFSSVALWHLKPQAINEVVWAKRGWQCVGVNTVACVGGCERRIIVDLVTQRSDRSNAAKGRSSTEEEEDYDKQDDAHDHDKNDPPQDSELTEDDDDSLVQAFTERYAREVINGHSEKCMWRKAGCKDDIYRLQVVRPAIWRPQLQRRYESVLGLASSIHSISLADAVEDATCMDVVDLLAPMAGAADATTPTATHSTQSKAMSIAMHGWEGLNDTHADLLQCSFCFQRIGLWMYQPGYDRPAATPGSSDEASHAADDTDRSLDALTMHREYCPWRDATSQCASGSLAGLNASEILVRVAKTYIREQRRQHSHDTIQKENVDTSPDSADLDPPKLTREEEDKADRERESKLQKLKRLLTVRRPRSLAQAV